MLHASSWGITRRCHTGGNMAVRFAGARAGTDGGRQSGPGRPAAPGRRNIAGKGIMGEPLEMLDWNTGDGPVLTHANDDGIGARITGFINFEKAGDYMMAIQSNDGVRLSIGGQLVIDDPDVHGDRFSPNVTLQVPRAGWYPLYLLYFERKGTSTLELYWQPPGAEGFDFVPGEAFAHRSKG